MSEWKTYRLGEITEKIGSGATPRGGKEVYLESGDISLIRSQNVLDFSFSKNGLAYISEEQANELRNVTIEKDDILLNITGDSVARVCKVPDELIPARVNQHVAIIRVQEERIDSDYLKYYLLEPSFKRYMLGLASSGGTRNALTKLMIENFEITAPNLSTQKSIASILSSLDDKIELNLQMNQTLEAMAQTIFKEWFVNFNFPGFDGKLVDGLPKGWEICKLRDLINIKHGFAFKGEYFTEEVNENILLTPGNFSIGGGFNYSKFKYYKGDVLPDYILCRNDLIVTMTDLSKEGDTLGYSALVPEIIGKRILHNQRIGKVEFKNKLPIKNYLYYLMRQPLYRNFVLGSATGSTVKHTSPSRICDYEILLPTNDILTTYEEVAKTTIERIQENYSQNQTLSQYRDSLLPKLMTGKIEVKENL